jgi:hypothetical protein
LGDLYLNIVESKNRDTGGFERQSVVLFADDMTEFLQGFDESLRVLEKAEREKRRGKARAGGEHRGRGDAGEERRDRGRTDAGEERRDRSRGRGDEYRGRSDAAGHRTDAGEERRDRSRGHGDEYRGRGDAGEERRDWGRGDTAGPAAKPRGNTEKRPRRVVVSKSHKR